MSSSSIETGSPSPPNFGSEPTLANQDALDQLDQDLVVAERIRDYSDEIYMYTRQQWIDWKHRVDRERAQAAAERNQFLRQRAHIQSQHPHHAHGKPAPPLHATPMGNTTAAKTHPSAHAVPVPLPTTQVDSIPIGIARPGQAGHATRQEPFNFYGPSSPTSEMTAPSSSDNSD